MDRDLTMYIDESVSVDRDLNLLYEAVIEEGANIDIYNTLKDFKKAYNQDLDVFYHMVADGDRKGAKAKIKEIQKNIATTKQAVESIDDSGFAGKVGGIGIKVMENSVEFSIKIIAAIAMSFVTGPVGNVITFRKETLKNLKHKNWGAVGNTIKAGIPTKEGIKNTAIMTSIFTLGPTIIKKMMATKKTIKSRNDKIEQIKNAGGSEEEIQKKVGNLYKSSILDYLEDLRFETVKMEMNI